MILYIDRHQKAYNNTESITMESWIIINIEWSWIKHINAFKHDQIQANLNTSDALWQEEQFKAIMKLLFKDNLRRNMLTMRIKGGVPLNFKSELNIKNKKWLQELKSNWELVHSQGILNN